MKTSLLLIIVIYLCIPCFAQDSFVLVNTKNNKTVSRYHLYDKIHLKFKDTLKNDTTVQTKIIGDIYDISKENIKLDLYETSERYFINGKLLYKKTYGSYCGALNVVPIKDISVIYKWPYISKICKTVSIVGLTSALLIAPIVSLNFKDFKDFKSQRYLTICGAGLGLALVGITVHFPFHLKHYYLDKNAPTTNKRNIFVNYKINN